MAAGVKQIIKYATWVLPHFLFVWRAKQLTPKSAPELVSKEVLAKNIKLKNRHQGERCFILANGPSVKEMDLTKLKGETVFSVSNGYLHAGYSELAPLYHCVPQITYGRMTEDFVTRWFHEIDEKIGEAELFLNETEAELVEKQGLFPGRKLHYVALRENFDDWTSREIIDLSQPIPRVSSVPVMTLMIAMHMGFKEIVLLGADHNQLFTGDYVYAFELGIQKGIDYSVNPDGSIATPLYDDLQGLARLWRQYRVIKEIAEKAEVHVVNASPTSALDEFPRVEFASLYKGVHA